MKWLLILSLICSNAWGVEVEATYPTPYEKTELLSMQRKIDASKIGWAIDDKDWEELEGLVGKYLGAEFAKALCDFEKGELTFPDLPEPKFFAITYKLWDYPNYPVDKGEYDLLEILEADNQGFPFTPALWSIYGKEMAQKAKTIYLRSKLQDESKPVGLCVGYKLDGSSDALIEAVDGAYDWLLLWVGCNIWEALTMYDWVTVKEEWGKKSGYKPLVVVSIEVELPKHAQQIRELNAILKPLDISVIYYEKD